MIIEPFRTGDIDLFLFLAVSEGWMADRWEFEFLLSAFPQGCFAAREDTGETAGFVTAVRHDRSGWIGNLIVAERFRGRGVGETLFRRALGSLHDDGAETVWLTASKAGKSLYEKHGFRTIDSIVRWVGAGRQRHSICDTPKKYSFPANLPGSIDCQAWGDQRDLLLLATIGRGKMLQKESGFAVIQPCGGVKQIGPFAAQDDVTAAQLLGEALGDVPFGSKVYIDAPVSNRSALRLYNRRNMRISGRTELMCAGRKPEYRSEYLYGLATMGSCG